MTWIVRVCIRAVVTEATFEERLQAVEARLNAKVERLEQERDEYKKLAGLLQEQVERMDHIVGYHLQRAAASGRQTMLAPQPVRTSVERMVGAGWCW